MCAKKNELAKQVRQTAGFAALGGAHSLPVMSPAGAGAASFWSFLPKFCHCFFHANLPFPFSSWSHPGVLGVIMRPPVLPSLLLPLLLLLSPATSLTTSWTFSLGYNASLLSSVISPSGASFLAYATHATRGGFSTTLNIAAVTSAGLAAWGAQFPYTTTSSSFASLFLSPDASLVFCALNGFTGGTQQLLAYRAASGAVAWQAAFGVPAAWSGGGSVTLPALSQSGSVLIAFDGASTISGLNASSGAQLWAVAAGAAATLNAARTRLIIASEGQGGGGTDFVGVDAESGAEVWTVSAPGALVTAAAGTQQLTAILFDKAANAGTVLGVGVGNGTSVFSTPAPSSLYGNAQSLVAVGTGGAFFSSCFTPTDATTCTDRLISTATGEEAWEWKPPSGVYALLPSASPPIVNDDGGTSVWRGSACGPNGGGMVPACVGGRVWALSSSGTAGKQPATAVGSSASSFPMLSPFSFDPARGTLLTYAYTAALGAGTVAGVAGGGVVWVRHLLQVPTYGPGLGLAGLSVDGGYGFFVDGAAAPGGDTWNTVLSKEALPLVQTSGGMSAGAIAAAVLGSLGGAGLLFVAYQRGYFVRGKGGGVPNHSTPLLRPSSSSSVGANMARSPGQDAATAAHKIPVFIKPGGVARAHPAAAEGGDEAHNPFP